MTKATPSMAARARRRYRRTHIALFEMVSGVRSRIAPAPPPATLVIGRFDGAGSPLAGAAIAPLIHPDHPIVNDYARLEALLGLTLRSIAAQQPGPLPAVVVGHRIPAFADDLRGHATIVSLGDRCLVPDLDHSEVDRRVPTRSDKGVKLLVAARVAATLHRPEFLITVDADDLLVRDVHAVAAACLELRPEAPGVAWSRGLEVTYRESDEGRYEIDEAIEVDSFHQRCGTCRAIRVGAFRHALDTCLAHYADALDAIADAVPDGWAGGGLALPARVTERLDRAFATMPPAVRRQLQHLGRHDSDHFGLQLIDFVGAAKVCEHGQHIGLGGGAMHRWDAVRPIDAMDAVERVGLARDAGR